MVIHISTKKNSIGHVRKPIFGQTLKCHITQHMTASSQSKKNHSQ